MYRAQRIVAMSAQQTLVFVAANVYCEPFVSVAASLTNGSYAQKASFAKFGPYHTQRLFVRTAANGSRETILPIYCTAAHFCLDGLPKTVQNWLGFERVL